MSSADIKCKLIVKINPDIIIARELEDTVRSSLNCTSVSNEVKVELHTEHQIFCGEIGVGSRTVHRIELIARRAGIISLGNALARVLHNVLSVIALGKSYSVVGVGTRKLIIACCGIVLKIEINVIVDFSVNSIPVVVACDKGFVEVWGRYVRTCQLKSIVVSGLYQLRYASAVGEAVCRQEVIWELGYIVVFGSYSVYLTISVIHTREP